MHARVGSPCPDRSLDRTGFCEEFIVLSRSFRLCHVTKAAASATLLSAVALLTACAGHGAASSPVPATQAAAQSQHRLKPGMRMKNGTASGQIQHVVIIIQENRSF